MPSPNILFLATLATASPISSALCAADEGQNCQPAKLLTGEVQQFTRPECHAHSTSRYAPRRRPESARLARRILISSSCLYVGPRLRNRHQGPEPLCCASGST